MTDSDAQNIVVFEDWGWQRLLPLVYMRSTFQLVCGMTSLLTKVEHLVRRRHTQLVPVGCGADGTTPEDDAASLATWTRPSLAPLVASETNRPTNISLSGETLLLNGRGHWRSIPQVRSGQSSWVGVVGNQVACVFAGEGLASTLSPMIFLDELQTRATLAGLPRHDVSEHVQLFEWPWEIVLANRKAIIDDRQWAAPAAQNFGRLDDGSYVLAPDSVHIGHKSRVKPCVVIDAENGPVWIGDDVTILPHSYIEGPAVIGDGTLLQPNSVVHAGSSIGPRCKVGGEIEESIIHGYSNKQHDGFLGHSYVGSWVNIAADCINSDLKNTYGSIRVPINGREVNTNEMFVGMIVGDYSKAGINVSFPTGAVIGFCSSIFAPRSPKFVPSFAWIDDTQTTRYDEKRGLDLARKVMSRRQRTMTGAEENVFLSVRRQALAIEHQPQVAIENQFVGVG